MQIYSLKTTIYVQLKQNYLQIFQEIFWSPLPKGQSCCSIEQISNWIIFSNCKNILFTRFGIGRLVSWICWNLFRKKILTKLTKSKPNWMLSSNQNEKFYIRSIYCTTLKTLYPFKASFKHIVLINIRMILGVNNSNFLPSAWNGIRCLPLVCINTAQDLRMCSSKYLFITTEA